MLVLTTSLTAAAQTASLRGTVTDSTGAVVVGADVTLAGSGFATRTAVTAPDGTFTFADVPPGPHVLRVNAPGFAASAQNVTVDAGGTVVTVTLQVAGLAERVTVLPSTPITASKNETSLGRINGGARVATAQDLESARIETVDELERILPEIKINPRSSRNYANVTVRGISSPNFYSPSVAVYVDGIPQDVSYLTQDLWNVERVELLKGPQGTLYGTNAVGGVLNIVTRKPGETLAGEVTFRGGTLGMGGHAALSGPLSTNRSLFGELVIARTQKTRGLESLDGLRPGLDEADTTFGKGAVRYAPVGGRIDLTVSHSRDAYDSTENIFVRDADLELRGYRGASIAAEPVIDREVATTALHVAYDLGTVQLSSVTAHQDRTFHRTTDTNNLLDEDQQTLSEEARLHYRSSRVNLISGIYYQHLEFDGRNGGIAGFTGPQSGIHDVDTFALFGDASYFLTPRLDVSAGLRYSYERAEVDFVRTGLLPLQFTAADTFNDVSPKFTLGYQLPGDARVYGAVSRGYKPGMFNRFVLSDGDAIAVKPERSWNYEAGTKSVLANGTVWLDLSAYWIRTDEGQFYVGVSPFQVLRNAGEVESRGVDLDVRWDTPVPDLHVTLGAAFNDATFIQFNDRGGNDFSGRRVPYTPGQRLALGTQYALATPVGRVAPRFYLSYVSRHYFNEANTSSEDGYVLADAYVDWMVTRRLSIVTSVQNLADTLYRTYRASATRNHLGPERSVTVGARVRF